MDSNSCNKSIQWPSGDCTPILATTLSLEELSERRALEIFRDQDDLDWFTGAVFEADGVGSALVMNHDNNPLKISVFYVDSGKDFRESIDRFRCLFKLTNEEINWLTPLCED